MPTLKWVVTSPNRKEGGKNENFPADDDSCSNDDRFSQTPDDLAQMEKKGQISEKKLSRYSSEAAPFSIALAIRNHRIKASEMRIRNRDGTTGNSINKSSATDVVAVVLSSATRQPPLPVMASHSKTSKSSGSSRIHLLIGDPSLARGQCARVSVTDSSSNIFSPAKEGLGRLQPGDVVRWNKLEVWKDYEEESPISGEKRKLTYDNSVKDHNHYRPLLSVVCDLSSSWRDPAAGPSLARLCRITPISSSNHGVQPKEKYDSEWETAIPPSMGTPKEMVRELAGWYCANARPHPTATHRPCQRRRLREIAAPNVLSHVVAKVLRCERARSKYSTPRKGADESMVTHATLSDGAGSDDLMGIAGGSARLGGTAACASSLPKSISDTLLRSMNEGSHVLLTHVLSRSASPSLQGRESLVLVPTGETTAVILAEDHPYFPRERSAAAREEENPFASQPLTLERASQLFSMTQQNSPPPIVDSTLFMSDRRGVMALVAPLVDVIVDGVDDSLVEGSHWRFPRKLSRFLIDTPSVSTGWNAIELRPSYRSASLVLDQTRVSKEIVVNADSDAMKMLCMDVPAEDMVVRDCLSSGSFDHPYLDHVGHLLRALCSESVPIRWVLEQESECIWFVTNASLIEI